MSKSQILRKSVIAPTVHLNGTSQDELLKQLADAVNAIRSAETALAEATPHGRDYYIQPGQAWDAAILDHNRRQHALDDVREELELIWQNVYGQNPNRKS